MDYFKRLGNFWFPNGWALVWMILALPALYFFQTFIHEGSHATAAFLSTGSFPKLAPYPHESAFGGALNGVTIPDAGSTVTVTERTSCDSEAKTTHPVLAGFPAVPQFLDLVLIAIFSLIFLFTSTPDPILRFLLRAWFMAAMLDFMYNTARGLVGICNPIRDWSKFQLGSDISTGVFALITWIFWLAVLSHFVWVYWSRWGQDPVNPAGFWDYRWVAFILGILSLIAIIFSLAVSDPAIIKDSFFFIAGLVVQIGAFVWYWLYFGLSFRFTG